MAALSLSPAARARKKQSLLAPAPTSSKHSWKGLLHISFSWQRTRSSNLHHQLLSVLHLPKTFLFFDTWRLNLTCRTLDSFSSSSSCFGFGTLSTHWTLCEAYDLPLIATTAMILEMNSNDYSVPATSAWNAHTFSEPRGSP